MIVLVVGNTSDPDSGYVGERLDQRGYVSSFLARDTADPAAPWLLAPRPDLLLLLGSPWSVHAPVDAAARDAECELVRDAVQDDVAILGLCYGAQIIAAALGGRVTLAAQPECGLAEVDTTAPDLVPAGPWVSFHADAIEAPPHAQILARSPAGVQAFSLPGVLGVQFHPEVRPEILAGWIQRFPDLVSTAAPRDRAAGDDLLARCRDRESVARQGAYDLVDAFLGAAVGSAD